MGETLISQNRWLLQLSLSKGPFPYPCSHRGGGGSIGHPSIHSNHILILPPTSVIHLST